MGYVMKADAFVKKAKDIANNYKTLYVLGCFGSPMTPANKKRYTTVVAYLKKINLVQIQILLHRMRNEYSRHLMFLMILQIAHV